MPKYMFWAPFLVPLWVILVPWIPIWVIQSHPGAPRRWPWGASIGFLWFFVDFGVPAGTQFRDIFVNVLHFKQENCEQNPWSVFWRVWDALEVGKVVFYCSKTHVFTNPIVWLWDHIWESFWSLLGAFGVTTLGVSPLHAGVHRAHWPFGIFALDHRNHLQRFSCKIAHTFLDLES